MGHAPCRLVPTPVPHPARVFSAGFSPNGASLVTTAQDGVARLWDTASGSLRAELKGETPIDNAVFSGSGARIVTKGGRVAQFWDAAGRPLPGTAAMRLEGPSPTPLWFVATAFTPSGNHVVTVASDGSRRLWDASSGTGTGVVGAGRSQDADGRVQPDGTLSQRAPAVDGLDLAGREDRVSRLPRITHDDVVNGIEFSPDGRFLLTASRDRSARLWKVTTGAQAGLLRHDQEVIAGGVQRQRVGGVTITPNGSVRMWDVRGALDTDEGTTPRTSPLNVESKLTAAEPSHGRVFTGGADGAVRAWSARTGVRSALLSATAAQSPPSQSLATGRESRRSRRSRRGSRNRSRGSGTSRRETRPMPPCCTISRSGWQAIAFGVTGADGPAALDRRVDGHARPVEQGDAVAAKFLRW